LSSGRNRCHLIEQAMLNELLNFLYPPRCAACDRRMPIAASRRVCASCLGRVDRLADPLCARCGIPLEAFHRANRDRCARCVQSPPAFARACVVARYHPSAHDGDSTLDAIIRRHKYGLDQSLGRALAECLGDELPLDPEHYDLVVPVPLHRARLRWRGFNQAALLGAAVARRIGRPLDVASLARTRPTPPQTMQDHNERARNVRNAFAIKRPARVAGMRVLLVDDVMTTGATANECARVLPRAGARGVDVFTLARAI
jgi:ComF family protein